MRTPASVLAEILRSDPARPRVTFYEDTPGPTQGERIELSGKVLANWISKAGNALQDEYDLGPGSVVRLSLPPHWRAVYWAFAVWAAGATLDLVGGPDPDLLVCDDPALMATLQATPDDVVLVTLAALARAHPGPVPPGAMDEARELATYGDQFASLADPAPEDLALITQGAHTPYKRVVPPTSWPSGVRVNLAGDLTQVLESTLAAWAVDGSVVLARTGGLAGVEPEGESNVKSSSKSGGKSSSKASSKAKVDRLASEHVTLDLA